jgi:hypothetical protein
MESFFSSSKTERTARTMDQIINMKHELVLLAGKIDWNWIDGEIAPRGLAPSGPLHAGPAGASLRRFGTALVSLRKPRVSSAA